MLVELTIQNIALIESLRIEFSQGFNVLTGETGAGKSIIVDCVNLALGGRADKDMIRTGADKGMVQALFDLSHNAQAKRFAEELGLDIDNDMIAISRELSRNGRNICRIAGIIMPLNTLKQLTGMLVDVHGQHEHQALLNSSKHLDFLDNFGGNEIIAKKTQVAESYRTKSKIASELKKLMADASEKERLTDMLTFQVQEISSAKLKAGEEEKLNRKLSMLENSEKIRTGLENAYRSVYQGDGHTFSAQEALLKAAESMNHIASLDEKFSVLAGRLHEIYYAAQDAGYELQSMLDGLQYEPELLDKIANRLDVIKKLERKYGATVEDVIQFGEKATQRLSELKSSDESIEALKKQYRLIDGELKAFCRELTELRHKAAVKLAEMICRQLADLGMAKTRFEVRIEAEPKPIISGADRVEFMISPNPGEPLRPLAAIASGGEISRIMLALKAIAMDCDGVDSMVFDEIDTGVSGRMAQTVGEKMCLIAKNKQVLCVTHLPQIAALGDAHFMVEKISGENRTDTNVRRLDANGRIHEISRLVGGAKDSASSLAHAEHMLAEAEEIRKQLYSYER